MAQAALPLPCCAPVASGVAVFSFAAYSTPATVTPPSSASSPAYGPPRTAPRKRHVLVWLTLAFVGALILAGAVLYAQRLSVAERVFRGVIGDLGLEADLRIERLGPDGLLARDLVLRSQGEEVARIDRVEASYSFRQALDGEIDAVGLSGVRATLRLDEEFRPRDPWLQDLLDRPGGGGGGVFPARGIRLERARVEVQTPFGTVPVRGQGTVSAPDRFDLALRVEPSAVDYRGTEARFGGPVRLAREGDALDVDAELALESLRNGQLEVRDAAVEVDGRHSLSGRAFNGRAALNALQASLGEASVDAASAMLDGTFSVDARTFQGRATASAEAVGFGAARGEGLFVESSNLAANLAAGQDGGGLGLSGLGTARLASFAGFDMEAEGVEAPFVLDTIRSGRVDMRAARWGFVPARARELADTLALRDVLSAAPITADFASLLADEAARALRGGALELPVAFDFEEGRRGVGLTGMARIRGARTLEVESVGDDPLYTHFVDAQQMVLRFHARLDGPRALALRDATLEARSPDGIVLAGVEGFAATLQTEAWRAETPEGRPATLAPLEADVRYQPSETVVGGALLYTGDIPGGYAEGLRTGGGLRIAGGDADDLEVFYAADTPVTIDSLLLPGGARVEGFSAELSAQDAPLFAGTPERGAVLAALSDARLTYRFELADGTPEAVDIAAARAEVEGQLRQDPQGQGVQDWTAQLADAALSSDTFIGAGTQASAPMVTATARLAQGEPLRFGLDAGEVRADTALASVRDMEVSLAGTSDDFEVEFGGGRFRADNAALPVVGLDGSAVFRNGEWVGTAAALLPGEQLEPLGVEFQFRDGAGVADVVIDNLFFQPDGGLQPQDYVPALRGRISQVVGAVSGRFQLRFGVGRELDGSGWVELDGLNLGTAPGPVEGLRGRVEIASLFPLSTEGRQTMEVASFDPGLPLENGTVVYELLEEGVRVVEAAWPFGDGAIRLEPLLWEYGAESNTAVLVVDGVSIQAFLDSYGTEAIQATGVLRGRLPVEVSGVSVEVRNGRVEVAEGGRFSYKAPQTDTAAAQNPTTEFAFRALEDFRYQTFALDINGPFDGDVRMELDFVGRTPAKLPSPPVPRWVEVREPLRFRFDVSITGPLFNILRSFDQRNIISRAKQQLCGADPERCGSILPPELRP